MSDSPAVIIFDVNGNPIGVTNVLGQQALKVDVVNSISSNGGGLAVSNLLSTTNFDLSVSAYTQNVSIGTDTLLLELQLTFSTTATRNITVSINGGPTLYTSTADTSLSVDIDFENYGVDAGSTIIINISQTGSPCLLGVLFTAQIGVATLAGNTATVAVNTDTLYPSMDAGNRLRVSDIYSLFETNFQYDNSPLFWDTISVGSGTITHVNNQSAVQLSVGTTSGDSIKFQTHNYLRYQPGKGQSIVFTGVLGTPTTNLVRRAGYYDDNDGAFFQVSSTGVAVVRRTSTSGSPVDIIITQSNWNLDKLDGTGPSGITLDTTKMQLMVIDLQWLSTGIIRYGFAINGNIIYCHRSVHSNILTTPYMGTANLPVRYELTNTGITSGTNTLLAVCSTVASEGGQQQFGMPFATNTGTTLKTVAAITVPIMSLRLKTTFNSIVNRGLIQLAEVDIASDQLLFMSLWLNGSLTGASFTDVNTTNSIAQFDNAATAITGGTRIYSSIVSGASNASKAVASSQQFGNPLTKILLSLNATGTVSDILTITCTRISTTANSVSGALTWLEFR